MRINNKRPRNSVGLVIGLVVAAAAGTAVLCGGQEPVRFSSRAALVLAPVQVRDEKGTPIRDLTEDDFVVLDNGKPQKLFSFDPPIPAAVEATPAAKERPLEFTNTSQQEAPRHFTILALDPINTKPGDQILAKRTALEFLSRPAAVAGPLAIVYFNDGGVRFIHHFSQDSAELRHSLEEATFAADRSYVIPIDTTKFSSGDYSSRKIKEMVEAVERDQQRVNEQSNADFTADSLRAVAEMFGKFPGEKTLIWITGGLRFRADKPALSAGYTSGEQGRGTHNENWSRAFRALTTANVAVYPVDARGLVAPGDLSDKSDVDIAIAAGTRGRQELEQQAHQEFITTLTWVAGETGGKALFNTNDLATAAEGAAKVAADSYLLTFQLAANAKPGRHRLEFKLRRSDLHVTGRSGFWVEADRKRPSEEYDIGEALFSPLGERGLPLAVRWIDTPAASGGAKRIVHFQLAVAPGSLTMGNREDVRLNLDIYALALDTGQRPVESFRRKVDLPLDTASREKLTRSGFSYKAGMELPPGHYTVKFVVRDNTTGRLGGVLASLDLP